MRNISFAQSVIKRFSGNVLAAAVVLGDVDNDGVRFCCFDSLTGSSCSPRGTSLPSATMPVR